MDIKQFAVNETSRLVIFDADENPITKDGKEMAVCVFGPASKQYQKAQAAQSNRMIDKIKRKGKTTETAEQKAAENAQFLADITDKFENADYDELKGRALAVAIYSDSSIGFVADQVAKFVGDWANFTKS